jgi:hypothetical protein
MSVGRLYEGYQYVMDNFYSFGHILERFPANIRRPVLFTAINAGMKNSLRAGKPAALERIQQLQNLIEDMYKRKIGALS